MLRLAGFLLLFASPIAAQGWETFSHDLGAGAAICPFDNADTGEFFCFAVACPPGETTPYIRIGFNGASIDREQAPLQVQVDGHSVARLFLTRISGDGDMHEYAIPIDLARDGDLIEALRAGTRATLVFGIGLKAVVQQISLRGSQAAIDQVAFMCHSVPLTAPAED